uniref:Uncharacterized protein n=1 Tax=Arundo donax TaxID=35708 RepID=A0A0A9AGU0_ARUDO
MLVSLKTSFARVVFLEPPIPLAETILTFC